MNFEKILTKIYTQDGHILVDYLQVPTGPGAAHPKNLLLALLFTDRWVMHDMSLYPESCFRQQPPGLFAYKDTRDLPQTRRFSDWVGNTAPFRELIISMHITEDPYYRAAREHNVMDGYMLDKDGYLHPYVQAHSPAKVASSGNSVCPGPAKPKTQANGAKNLTNTTKTSAETREYHMKVWAQIQLAEQRKNSRPVIMSPGTSNTKATKKRVRFCD